MLVSRDEQSCLIVSYREVSCSVLLGRFFAEPSLERPTETKLTGSFHTSTLHYRSRIVLRELSWICHGRRSEVDCQSAWVGRCVRR